MRRVHDCVDLSDDRSDTGNEPRIDHRADIRVTDVN